MYDRPAGPRSVFDDFKPYMEDKEVQSITETHHYYTYLCYLDEDKKTNKQIGIPIVAIQWSMTNAWERGKGFTTPENVWPTIEKISLPTPGKDPRYGLDTHIDALNGRYTNQHHLSPVKKGN
jgi:hypothetical protein